MQNKNDKPRWASEATNRNWCNGSSLTEESNHFYSISDIKAGLSERLPELISQLFSNRNVCRLGSEFRIGNNGSVVIKREGWFYDFESCSGGDLLQLVQFALRTDFKGSLAWCRDFLGAASYYSAPLLQTSRTAANSKSSGNLEKALRIWGASGSVQKTLGDEYLHGRGLILPCPPSLRFNASLWNYTTRQTHAALVAAIQNYEHKITGVSCVFLNSRGQKISGEGVKPKLIFGQTKGSAVRLAPTSSSLILAEGVEDALSILQSCPESTVWATLGTSGLIGIEVPKESEQITIACDTDPAGITAARRLAQRLISEGKKVSFAYPPSGKDFNQFLVGGAA